MNGFAATIPILIVVLSAIAAMLANVPAMVELHFAPAMMMEAIAIYRARFRPSAQLAAPYVMLTSKASLRGLYEGCGFTAIEHAAV